MESWECDVLGAAVVVGVFEAEAVERDLDFVFGEFVALVVGD